MFETKNKRFLLVIFSLSIFILAVIFVAKNRNKLFYYLKVTNDYSFINHAEKVLGVYTKETVASFDTMQSFTHISFILNTDNTFQVENSLLNTILESNNILITIEFHGRQFFTNYKNNPSEQIINGLYDKKLELVERLIFMTNKKVYVRFNPEMEVPVNKFPWQNQSGKLYIESYRYLVTKLRNRNPNLKFVWGPAGFMGAEEYYPGNDVVDMMSITLKSETENLFTRYPTYTDFSDEIHRKLHRLRFFNHPVMFLGTQNANNRLMIFDYVRNETDTITKYKNIAYDESLWSTTNTTLASRKFIFGLHDPMHSLTNDPAVSAEHIFVDFGQVQSGELNRLLHEVFSRNHEVILTVEPWRDLSGIPDSSVLLNILAGKYDSIINRIYADISETTHTVYLRFAHEMEIPITRYAWQSQNPLTYIRAFRYFMSFAQPFPQNVKRIWGPAGDRASIDFYPGNDVVDYVSFAIYGLPDKNITDHEKQATFSKIFNSKLWRFRQIYKPIFITEFGVKGPEDYQDRWLEDAANTLNNNPQVVGINYFNMSDTPGAWGQIKAPDWSITSSSLHRFMEILERDNQ